MTERKEQQINSAELRRRSEELNESLRLRHELQVHQYELERQNAELCKVRDELVTTLEQYTDLYDFAPVGYFTLDRTGTISRVNFTGSGFFGGKRSRLVSSRLEDFFTDEARPAFNAFLERVFTSPAKESCEVAVLKGENGPLFVQVEGLATPSRQECRIALIDITDHKLAELALRKVEEAAEVALRKVEEAADVALRKVEDTVYNALENADAVEALSQTIAAAANEARKLVEDATKEARRKVIEASEIAEALRREQRVTDLKKVEQSAGIARQRVEDATVTARQEIGARTHVHQTWAEASDKLRQEKVSAEAASQTKSQCLANVNHELIEITARLKLMPVGNRSPEDDLLLSSKFREEVVALLDRLQNSTSIGAISDFDVHQVPFVKVDIVK